MAGAHARRPRIITGFGVLAATVVINQPRGLEFPAQAAGRVGHAGKPEPRCRRQAADRLTEPGTSSRCHFRCRPGPGGRPPSRRPTPCHYRLSGPAPSPLVEGLYELRPSVVRGCHLWPSLWSLCVDGASLTRPGSGSVRPVGNVFSGQDPILRTGQKAGRCSEPIGQETS